ncbi:hypothetical protein D6D22_09403 [Aureobasidium pullulans]|uniref:Uncharacterized protein n=1 Tax=Aureobasidium pullulans TaxID=5580 RepID=A0A4S8X199_AURPU|nr:hypothetical protein D6D22_09403 [Aureobasidium pullulans]
MLNDTLVASAARLHRVRKELLSTPSGIRQPEFGSSSSLRPSFRSLDSQRPLLDIMVFNNMMDNLPIRREFEEHMEHDNRPVTVMTSAGLVTLDFTEVQGNDAWLGEQPVLGLPKRKISQQPHLHDGGDFERRSTWSKIPKNLETIRIVCSQISLLKTHILGAMRTSEEKRHLERYLLEQRLYYNQHSSD